MDTLGPLLVGTWIVGNIYFPIMIIVKMFENDMAALGWWSIFFMFVCWGSLFTFLVGWVYSGAWDCKRWMWAWTIWWFAPVLVLAILAA
jgi:hypothetical protein